MTWVWIIGGVIAIAAIPLAWLMGQDEQVDHPWHARLPPD